MEPGLSRQVGRVLGTSNATPAEREKVTQALKTASTWSDFPRDVQRLLSDLTKRAKNPPTVPNGE